MNLALLLALACAPGVFIVGFIWFKDRYEKEPAMLLMRSFFYGVASIVLTLAISVPLSKVIPVTESELTQQAIHAFLVVALVEEGSKYLLLRWVLFHNKHFNEPFDGIIYSVMVGMGFATAENIAYVVTGGYEVAVIRMFTAVPAHAVFAILMGYYLGHARFGNRTLMASILALAIPALLHGTYDYFLFINFLPGLWMGGAASLLIGVLLSRRAIASHQQASPFRSMESDEQSKQDENG